MNKIDDTSKKNIINNICENSDKINEYFTDLNNFLNTIENITKMCAHFISMRKKYNENCKKTELNSSKPTWCEKLKLYQHCKNFNENIKGIEVMRERGDITEKVMYQSIKEIITFRYEQLRLRIDHISTMNESYIQTGYPNLANLTEITELKSKMKNLKAVILELETEIEKAESIITTNSSIKPIDQINSDIPRIKDQ